MTQAAVSKRIRQLENWFGTALFIRSGRSLVLSEQGKQLLERAAMALDYLEAAVQALSDNDTTAVRVSVNSSIFMFWLLPRIKTFGLSDNACSVDLMTSDNPGDQLSADNDLSIVYSDGNIPGWECFLLLKEELAPVASPELADKLHACPDGGLLELAHTVPPALLNYTRIVPTWFKRGSLGGAGRRGRGPLMATKTMQDQRSYHWRGN